MDLGDHQELAITKEKLRALEEWYAQRLREPAEDAYVRSLSLRSVKEMIHQLKEEILRFEARAKKE
jgi:hypothetical protein